jgi:hypothetical protein
MIFWMGLLAGYLVFLIKGETSQNRTYKCETSYREEVQKQAEM